MHNTLALLTQQTMARNYYGHRTAESDDNSQLILGLYRLEDAKGIITVPKREHSPENLKSLSGQLSEGVIIASKSFYDERPIEEIANELAKKYDGSGGYSIAGHDLYRCIEFATLSKEKMLSEYFK